MHKNNLQETKNSLKMGSPIFISSHFKLDKWKGNHCMLQLKASKNGAHDYNHYIVCA